MPAASAVGSVVDELTYRSYACNRRRAPAVAPERWAHIFADVPELEARFQAELTTWRQVEKAAS